MSLHTSFLRVIMHHGALQAVQPAYHWLRSTTGHYRPCSLRGSFWRRRQLVSQPESQPEIDLIHHSKSTTKLWRLCPWLLLQPTAVHQVNLPFSYYRSKGTSLPRWRRGTTTERSTSFTRQPKPSTSCAFPSSTTTTPSTTTTSQPKGTTSLQSTTDDNGSPCHMDSDLVPASH